MTGEPLPSQPRLLNRERSWLRFNQRVLEEARDPSNPLLERVKFFCIVSTNLDEFFEVRVAGLRQQVAAGIQQPLPDGLLPNQALEVVREDMRRQVDELYLCWRSELVPQLAHHGIRFLTIPDLDDSDLAWLESYFRERVFPVLTPLAIDSSHPFPLLLNKMLNVVVRLVDPIHGEPVEKMAVIQVPPNLPRLVRLPRSDHRHDYLFLGRVIGHFLERLFQGMEILGFWHIRVTRNSELYIESEDKENLLRAVEQELHNRLKGEAVRLEVSHDTPPEVCEVLLNHLDLTESDLYRIEGPLHPSRIMHIGEGLQDPTLRDRAHLAPVAPFLRGRPDLFAAIRERDVLLHHPYESFNSVVAFLQQSAADPHVLAIKQTLYRTGGDARIIDALIGAARSGKQVTAIVELKARFDEHNNIQWARKLEEAGVHVVYGLLGYKIHCKVALVVRAENDGLRRYVHVATGNYNATTSRIYTDLGMLTCRPDFGEDATALFNLLTGICQFRPMRKFILAPFELHSRMLSLIRREQANAESGLPARIFAKMNSLVDPAIIDALYEASQKGVEIDLVVRGICCLRAGIPGLSERIRVRSIVDRFLEHSRIYCFDNAGRPQVFIGSADWMPRNFFRRIEVIFPVEDGTLRERILSEIIHANLTDNLKARLLQPDGSYLRPNRSSTEPARRCQQELIDIALGGPQTGSQKATAPAPSVGEIAARRRAGTYPKITVRRRPETP